MAPGAVATPLLKHDMVGLKRAYMSYFGRFQNVLKPFKISFIQFESIYWLMISISLPYLTISMPH
jgi:hypothetical protein